MKTKNWLKRTVNKILLNAVVKVNRLGGLQPVHFLHVGKTGGTILKVVLHPSESPESKGMHGHRSIRKTKSFLIKSHLHSHKLKDVPHGEKVFFCVRNPINRFVSGFYSRKRQGKPMYFAPWSDQEKKAFEYFDTPNDLALALSSKEEDERQMAETAMQSIRHVREKYSYWFGDEEYFKSRLNDVLFVLQQENLGDDFERLKPILGLPEELHLPEKGKKGHANPDSVDKSLDEGAILNLKNWYKEDYRFLETLKEQNLIENLDS